MTRLVRVSMMYENPRVMMRHPPSLLGDGSRRNSIGAREDLLGYPHSLGFPPTLLLMAGAGPPEAEAHIFQQLLRLHAGARLKVLTPGHLGP